MLTMALQVSHYIDKYRDYKWYLEVLKGDLDGIYPGLEPDQRPTPMCNIHDTGVTLPLARRLSQVELEALHLKHEAFAQYNTELTERLQSDYKYLGVLIGRGMEPRMMVRARKGERVCLLCPWSDEWGDRFMSAGSMEVHLLTEYVDVARSICEMN